MMHLRWAVPVILAVGGACASTPVTSPPPQDAGSEADSDPCAGLGCPVGLPSVTLAVQDTTGTPVPGPYFSEGSNQLLFQCDVFAADAGAGDAGDAGPGKVCAKWKMYLKAGKHPITIDAQGYVSQTLDVDLKGPTGCCGQGEQLEKTVTLAKQ